MANIRQTTISNTISLKKIFVLWLMFSSTDSIKVYFCEFNWQYILSDSGNGLAPPTS